VPGSQPAEASPSRELIPQASAPVRVAQWGSWPTSIAWVAAHLHHGDSPERHVLPEAQIADLPGWEQRRFRFSLKKDDFLDVKLGPKPVLDLLEKILTAGRQ
jgi:hypothetical protein